MTPAQPTPQRTLLHAALVHAFNLEGLRQLCFNLKLDPDNFGATPAVLIRELLLYGERTGTTAILIARARALRPNFAIDPAGGLFAGVPRLEKEVFGRADQIEALVAQLTGADPLALVLSVEGSGGVGKTTLALALAHDARVRAHFADGVLWVGLGTQNDVAGALNAWAEALGIDVTQLPEVETRATAIAQAIGLRQMLLIIDDAWDKEAALTLRRCAGPGCACLLTTRDGYIAKQFAAKPDRVSKVLPLGSTDAFALVQALAPEACAANPVEVKKLAHQVGGLPLALELLGSYLAIPEHTEFAELRADSLAHLADPHARLQLAQQRLGDKQAFSLQAVIELSLYDLNDAAQHAWDALGAFAHKPATFSLAAAKAVGQCDAATLATLLRRNLLERVEGGEDLTLHQTLAEAAQARLTSAGAMEAARQRHRQFYLDLANKDRDDWRVIEAAYPQIQQSWRYMSRDEMKLDIIEALRVFHERRGLWRDQLQWLEVALEICDQNGWNTAKASILNNVAGIYLDIGDLGQSLQYLEQTLLLDEASEDKESKATTLNNIGMVYDALGQRQQALTYYERALPISEEVGARAMEGTTLNNIGTVYDNLGQRQQALTYFERALPIREKVGDRSGESVTRFNMALVYEAKGQLAKAVAQLERVVAIDEEVSDPNLESDRAVLARVRAKLQEQ